MKYKRVDGGFSLVEVIVALVIVSVGLGFLSLLFTRQRLNTIDSEIRSGAVVFSQRILDNLRQKDPNILPRIATKQCPPSTGASEADLNLCPPDISSSNPYSYQADITFSEDATECKDNCRKIELKVMRDGQQIYRVETIYTKFE